MTEQVNMPQPYASIIIPAYNSSQTIRKCLDAILNQDYPSEQFEIIVVDNNSSDNTPQIVQEYPVTLIFECEIQGPHAATNAGVRIARGKILVFTDSDCVPQPGWLAGVLKPFDDENIVGVGGRIEAYRPSSRIERFLAYEISPHTNCIRLADDFPVAIITGNAAWRADAVRAVGLFNPNLYTGGEVDLSWRIQWKTGKDVKYVDEAIVHHMYESNLRRLFRYFHIYGYSEILLATLHGHRPNHPMSPPKQFRRMLSQCKSVMIYMASFFYRLLIGWSHKKENSYTDYITTPLLWLVSELGSIYGKLQGIWHTRFYRVKFWENGPRVI